MEGLFNNILGGRVKMDALRKTTILWLMTLLLVLPGLAAASTITFDSSTGITDTQIANWWPSSDLGNLSSFAAYDHPIWHEQGLIRFDNLFGNLPGQIPLGSTINDATLRLYVYGVQDPAQTLELYRMNAPWAESVTWNSIGGGVTPGVQAEGSPDAVTTGIGVGFLDIAVAPSLIAWANGSANYGWVVTTDASHGVSYTAFISSEGQAAFRPTLSVDYTSGGPAVPEPGTLLLLASGAAALGFGRRFRKTA